MDEIMAEKRRIADAKKEQLRIAEAKFVANLRLQLVLDRARPDKLWYCDRGGCEHMKFFSVERLNMHKNLHAIQDREKKLKEFRMQR